MRWIYFIITVELNDESGLLCFGRRRRETEMEREPCVVLFGDVEIEMCV